MKHTTLLMICLMAACSSWGKKTDFYQRAAKLGHSAQDLKAGKRVATIVTVTNVEQLRNMLDIGLTRQQREAQANKLLGNSPMPSKTDFSEKALSQKSTAYLYGNYKLSGEERKAIDKRFPMRVYAVSAPSVTYSAPTDLDSGQIPLIYNFQTVVMTNQADVYVQSSPLTFTMDTFIRTGTPPAGMGDFNILGLNGATGSTGGTGSQGSQGSNGSNTSSVALHTAYWPPCPCCFEPYGGAGGQGGQGGQGNPGSNGGDGQPSAQATITVTSAAVLSSGASMKIFTTPGSGGNGGTGGTGGIGGTGGTGGSDSYCINHCGPGGPGGVGGTGGTGGTGGNGANANSSVYTISVYVPARYMASVSTSNALSQPGNGGGAGTGGGPGTGGTGGTAPDSQCNSGGPGSQGSGGTAGQSGTVHGQPATIQVLPY